MMKSGLKKGSQREKETESQKTERETEKCAFEENISRLHGNQASLLLLPHRGPISADESRSLFEVAPWHYPCILHQVIERPESMVGGSEKGGHWAESFLQVFDSQTMRR